MTNTSNAAAFALTLLALSACATPQETPPPAPIDAASAITLFEGGCFYYSSCDTYTFTLRPDGGYKLERRDSAGAPVVSEGSLSAQTFAAAEAVLRDGGFASLPATMNGSDLAVWRPDVYPCMNHAPGVRITRAAADGAQKEVYWDRGCRSAAMDAFVARLRAAIGVEGLGK
jgi:hypothetical protein